MIWIVHPHQKNQPEWICDVVGNFGARIVASWESLCFLMAVSSQSVDSFVFYDSKIVTPPKKHVLQKINALDFKSSVIAVDESFDSSVWSRLKIAQKKNIEQNKASRGVFLHKDLEFCTERFNLTVAENGQRSLSRTEGLILKTLLHHPGQLVSRETLRENVWKNIHVSARTIDCHVSRLRRHLQESETQIVSVYGSGYRLE